jgi:hypothetical protein
MAATASTNAYTGDGTTTTYEIGFPFLDEADVRVLVAGALKVRGTDYNVQNPVAGNGKKALIKFASAPANAATVKFYRNTPIVPVAKTLNISNRDALTALYRNQEFDEAPLQLPFTINATDLAAGTAQSSVAQCDGYIDLITTRVDTAIVTGGDITVEVGGTAVTGLTVTVANSAAVGTTQNDAPTTPRSSTTKVKRGQVITVTPAAAFNGGGAMSGYLTFQPADL